MPPGSDPVEDEVEACVETSVSDVDDWTRAGLHRPTLLVAKRQLLFQLGRELDAGVRMGLLRAVAEIEILLVAS